MNITCTECGKDTTAQVTKTPPHKVVCEHCHGEIRNVSPFTLKSLVREKKFATTEKKAFTFFCDNDKEHLPGTLAKDAKNQDVIKCTKCGNPMKVSQFMISQFKEISKVK